MSICPNVTTPAMNVMVDLLTEWCQKKYTIVYPQEWSNILMCKEHHVEEQEFG
jgi:hypothetical protein